MYSILTLTLFAVIISSLTLPAFAEHFEDRHFDEFPNCTILEGFVSDVDDSTGPAQECLISSHNEFLDPDFFALDEITQYCMQYRADQEMEKKCIDDYPPAKYEKIKSQLFIFVLVFFVCGLIIEFIGSYNYDFNFVNDEYVQTTWQAITTIVGLIMIGLAIVISIFGLIIPGLWYL